MNTKQVKDLEVGDVVFTKNSGEGLTIVCFHRGFLRNSRFLEYQSGEWSCLPNDEEVEVGR